MGKDLTKGTFAKAKGMTRDLTQGAPAKVLAFFALSMIATSMMSYVYSTTDAMMASWFVDKHAMGAISAISPAYSVLNGFLSATYGGFAIYAGRVFGAGDEKRLKKLMANAVLLAVVSAIPVTVAALLLSGQVATLMNIPQTFRNDSIIYFAILTAEIPISAVTWVCAGMFRALGDSRSALWRAGVSGGVNVVFNFFFMGVFHMGIAGASLGTLCASLASALMCLWQLWRHMPMLHFGRQDLKFNKSIVRILLSNGLPMGLLSTVLSAGSLILQIAVNGHSESVITGVSLGGRLMTLMWIAIQNFESSLVYFAAQNLGAAKYARIKQGFWSCLWIMLGLGAAVAALSIFGGEYFFRLFVGWGNEPDVLEILRYSEQYIFTQVIFFPFIAVFHAARGTIKGVGNTVPAVLCGVIELVARIAVAVISTTAPISEEVKLWILYFAGPAAWVGATVFLLILLPRTFRKMEQLHQKEEAETAALDREDEAAAVH